MRLGIAALIGDVNVFFFQQHLLNFRVLKKLLHGFMNCFLFKLVGEKKKGGVCGDISTVH